MTYSIVAHDPGTGQLGVAVQSHWFSVGAVVPGARPGVGAVATQATLDLSYGSRGLALLEAGAGAQAAVAELTARDPLAASRQLGIVDARGGAAAHTGSACIAYARHLTGDGVSCQANLMAREGVPAAMRAGYQSATGALAERLLAALDAGEAAGGDLRGRQSAALLVVPARGESWETVVSLRVEDDPDPLGELRRLVSLNAAYTLAEQADELSATGHLDEAAERYRRAGELAPDNHELRFWAGLGAFQAGEKEVGLTQVRAAIAQQPNWRELLARLPADLAPGAAEVWRLL